MASDHAPARLAAVLGPTNTGKTHYAIERMLAHRDGMIGLPLRLLAREVYDRVVKVKGKAAAALITGEEKIAPDSARYFICTVEAMPLDRRTSFLAVDEIQLARDTDRGHVFTDRLLRARGLDETLFLGSDAMRPIIARLLPGVEIMRRERLSTLSYAGAKKLTKIPRRTAIVAFSAEEVYAIAELIRRQKGGAAIVMGALSPRTRNAQVGLYQSGEVDVLVATDAIGMGLNMDVDHVAFASRVKFDGRHARALRPDEVAQIAGRAGRYREDGAFGETGDCPPFGEETISRVENHEFEPIDMIEWRTPALAFTTVPGLLRSLEAPPPASGLVRARGASDEETLRRLAAIPEIVERTSRPGDVRRLWDVCLTPDFRRGTIDEHAALMAQFAAHLLGPRQRLPQDWIARAVDALDRADGEIDVLQGRLAAIRTWTYAANRPDWLDDCEHWRERTRAIEDKLSDTLHEALMRRFIDRRTSALVRGLKREDALDAGVSETGAVTVEGHYLGRLVGLAFDPDPEALGQEGRAVRHAAAKALRPVLMRRLGAIASAEDNALSWTLDGHVLHEGVAVARIVPGAHWLKPDAALLGGETAAEGARERARLRIKAYLESEIARRLPVYERLEAAAKTGAVTGLARGLAYQWREAGLALDQRAAAPHLSAAERRMLWSLGLSAGRTATYAPAHMTPAAAALAHVLRPGRFFPPEGLAPSVGVTPETPPPECARLGYLKLGARAVRADLAERLMGQLLAARRLEGPSFTVAPALAAAIGCPKQALPDVLRGLGLAPAETDPETGAPAKWRFRRRAGPEHAPAAPVASGPFAALAEFQRPPPAPVRAPRRRASRRKRTALP
jgi:ATP-dependent RNA helicase SUPV3L1/SUV3